MIGASLSTWGAQLLDLSVALVLSTAIGCERQLRGKSAGMRTHALVGLGAALFMIISKYGFDDVLVSELVRVDPSRVAAQVVSGIGFIGAGLVLVRRNKVRGLTMAASIWMVAAVGSAAGAGLIIPAVFVTLAHFFVAYLYPFVVRHTRLGRVADLTVQVQYATETGALQLILEACTELGFAIVGFVTSEVRESIAGAWHTSGARGSAHGDTSVDVAEAPQASSTVEVELELNGTSSISLLVRRLSELENVRGCR